MLSDGDLGSITVKALTWQVNQMNVSEDVAPILCAKSSNVVS